MRHYILLSALMAAPTLAQAPAPAPSAPPPAVAMAKGPVTFVPASEVETFLADARKNIKPGQTGIFKPVLMLAPYMAALEYRVATANANVHPKEAEFIYVIAGGGTIVTGGTLVAPKTRPDGNINGSGVAGGTPRHLAPGDIMIVPEGVPHLFNQFDRELVMLTMKAPRTAPTQ